MKALSIVRRYGFIYNPRSGGGHRGRLLREARERLRHKGHEVREYISEGDPGIDAAAAVRDGCHVVVACGGDGTVNGVARAVVGTDAVLGVLPLGTLNHFAKDLGLHTLPHAEHALEDFHVRSVDAGYVNGQLFVNNSGIGIYPAMVLEREKIQKQGITKWLAFVWACLKTLVRMPLLRLRIEADGHKMDRTTPVLFVGNNVYAVQGKTFGHRARLDAGVLGVCIARHRGPTGLIRLAFRALFGLVHQDREFTALTLQHLTVDRKHHKPVQVSLDGEVRKMRTPLEYRIAPGVLKVLV